MTCLDYGRHTIAWGCVGLAQACLEASVQYSRTRKQFGRYIMQNQLIEKMLAEMVVEIKAARQLCFYAGYMREKETPIQ